MRISLTSLALGFLITSSITACSFIPTSSEPQLGAALASDSASESVGPAAGLTVSGVLFDSDEATLQPAANSIVSQAVDYLRSNPGTRVLVEGHTDRTGTKRHNQKLSEKRALAIANAINANGIDIDRITAVGLGETSPMADNNTPDGRRANRRVEIHFEE